MTTVAETERASKLRAGAGTGEAAVVVRGLVKRYGGRAVVDRLDLTVPRGELLALLGPNGAGKTTTVEVLEGYRQADEGEVRVLGLDPIREGPALRSRIGLMLQGGGVYPQARPREILQLFGRFYRSPRDADELLDLVGLRAAATTRYRVLSGGQKQRLALALALVGRPELVVLDEPTAGMDPAAKASTRALISDLRASGITVLLTTHELADVERLADRVAIIDRGRLVALGSVAELSGSAAGVIRFRAAKPLTETDRRVLLGALMDGRAVADAEVVPDVVSDTPDGTYRVRGLAPTPAVVARLAAWAAERGLLLPEIRAGGGTLEERYLELTGEHREEET
ncbi:MAG TPA: ABC transporter ATP-binding protein [Candidatus Limnocylindrales bacterium]